MKWLNGYRIRLVLVGCVAVVVLGGGPANADFTFGQPVNLGPVVNSPSGDFGPFVAPDGLTLYFNSERPGGPGGGDIWVTTRATVSDAWGPPVNLGATVNSSGDDWLPTVTADGLTLYFSSLRPGGLGLADIWMSTRATASDAWGSAVNLGSSINSAGDEFFGCISEDGCSLYFSNSLTHSGDYFYGGDIYVTTRPTKDSPWGPPVNLGLMPSRGGSGNWNPSVSSDGLALFFESDYVNISLFPDIWLATRTSNDSKWGTPILLGPEINTQNGESRPSISADGRTLYFCSNRPGGYGQWDIWQAPVIPIVDFNSDGIVDIKDLVRLIESWGKDDPSLDMGPMPWGDGKIDAADLEVLMSYWEQEILDPALVVYWRLDEAEGLIAADSAGENDATLSGGPLWQPEAGQVGGALQLDGVDDCVITPFILSPAVGQLSVFAWVKGGIAGQVIVSQIGGADWLCADPSQGRLMTGLVPPPSRTVPAPLVSELVITDGNWHRIGFVWDGSHRRLYVDGVVAAEDAQDSLAGSNNGLYIGCGKARGAGTFWSGLIDDIRIYTRDVRP